MATPTSLDTNCLLRWLLGDIPAQSRAVDDALAAREQHVADMALLELVYALETQYDYPRDLIAENLKLIMAHPNINCNRTLLHHAVALYLTHPAVSFVDCCLALYAKFNDAAPLFTFDRKLANQLQYAELLKA